MRIEHDLEVDEMIPGYMYPNLGIVPWNDPYLKQDNPPLRKQWWINMYQDLPEGFSPDAVHTMYNDEELGVACLGKGVFSIREEKSTSWNIIL
jgi:hypothetical protein